MKDAKMKDYRKMLISINTCTIVMFVYADNLFKLCITNNIKYAYAIL